ncbi:MAG: hypothetical protein LH614_17145 [Pyrinomonadaceae bacterium]|nr:hypothetical protein [Pyrinomonadaceae bacterium]
MEGKKHDKKLADEETIKYPENTVLQQDTGFLRRCARRSFDQTAEEKTARQRIDESGKGSESGVKSSAGGDRTFD